MKYIRLMTTQTTMGGQAIRRASRRVLAVNPWRPFSQSDNRMMLSFPSQCLAWPGASAKTRSMTDMSLAFAADTQSLGREESRRMGDGCRCRVGGAWDPGTPRPIG